MRRTVVVAAVIAVPLSFGLSLPAAADPLGSRTGGGEDAASAAAVRAITDPSASTAAQVGAVPAGVGYRPAEYRAATGPGYAIDPDGECSSVVPLPADFTAPCRGHDLGYDVLRHAASVGRPLGGWARTRLDDTLSKRLSAVCAVRPADQRRRCSELAGLTVLAVRANTWREHDGPPRDESAAELAVSWLTGGGRL